jgi:hypothetical protein
LFAYKRILLNSGLFILKQAYHNIVTCPVTSTVPVHFEFRDVTPTPPASFFLLVFSMEILKNLKLLINFPVHSYTYQFNHIKPEEDIVDLLYIVLFLIRNLIRIYRKKIQQNIEPG